MVEVRSLKKLLPVPTSGARSRVIGATSKAPRSRGEQGAKPYRAINISDEGKIDDRVLKQFECLLGLPAGWVFNARRHHQFAIGRTPQLRRWIVAGLIEDGAIRAQRWRGDDTGHLGELPLVRLQQLRRDRRRWVDCEPLFAALVVLLETGGVFVEQVNDIGGA
jgi:hypothetical protein